MNNRLYAPLVGDCGAVLFDRGHNFTAPVPASVPTTADFDSVCGDHKSIALRYRIELSWLATLPGLSPRAASVLAARAAACFASLPALSSDVPTLHPILQSLANQTPDMDSLAAVWRVLSDDRPSCGTLTSQDFACAEALWPIVVPTECLLASGGDERLLLDSRTGLNRYGCSPWPRPDLVTFASCTASSLSGGAFAAAESARQKLAAAMLRTAPSVALAEASDDIASALLDYYRVSDLAEAVLAASGTDAALVVTGLLAAERPGDILTSIVMSPSETGSGVPDAVQGRHFATSAAAGCKVGKGQPIEGLPLGPGLVTVALRHDCGAPRTSGDIAADCRAAIHAGVAQGRVVLHAIDGSKTGLTAPDRSVCRQWADEYHGKLDIVVDACQARVEPALVRWYLQQGFPVLVTGSKFFTAPGFCGAVLFPQARLRKITKHGRLPAGLAPYARLEGGFGSRRCPGLMLRWRAALHEMHAFAQMEASDIRTRLHRIECALIAALSRDRRLKLVDAPRPEGPGWSGQKSVFTFAIRAGGQWLNTGQLRDLYTALNSDMSALVPVSRQQRLAAQLCQIGQPVELGSSRRGGLRLAVSAAQVVQGCDQRLGLLAVVDKLSLLLNASALGDLATSPARSDAPCPAQAVTG